MRCFLSLKDLIFPVIFPFLCIQESRSFDGVASNDARSLALGNVYSLSREFSNPAALSFQSGNKISTSVHNQFQMNELNTVSLRGAFPNRILDSGFQLDRFGYEDFSINSIRTGLAKKVNPRLSLGVQLGYSHVSSILEIPAQSVFNAGVGMFYKASETILLGVYGKNIASSSKENSYAIHSGIDYQCTETCHLLFELSFDRREQLILKSGIDYEISEGLHFYAGIHQNPTIPSIGVSCQWKQVTIMATFVMHHLPGNSGMIESGYSF